MASEESIPPRGRFRRARVIYNPNSGRGPHWPWPLSIILGAPNPLARRRHQPDEDAVAPVLAGLKAFGIEADMAVTCNPGEGTRLAQEAVAEGCDLVVAVGGDGTLNEVVNALARTQTVLGVVPAGSVNLFGRQFNLPGDVAEACRRIATGEIRSLDLGRVRDRYFLCVAGIGFDAFVIRSTDSGFKRAAGTAAYAWVALNLFFSYPFQRILLRCDDEPFARKAYLAIVGNGKYYAGEMVLLPQADMEDGYLDVALFKRRRWRNFLGYLWGLKSGSLGTLMDFETLRCRRLEVGRWGRHCLHVDGEYWGKTPAQIEVVPGALRAVV